MDVEEDEVGPSRATPADDEEGERDIKEWKPDVDVSYKGVSLHPTSIANPCSTKPP
jgi:hypothetical protein